MNPDALTVKLSPPLKSRTTMIRFFIYFYYRTKEYYLTKESSRDLAGFYPAVQLTVLQSFNIITVYLILSWASNQQVEIQSIHGVILYSAIFGVNMFLFMKRKFGIGIYREILKKETKTQQKKRKYGIILYIIITASSAVGFAIFISKSGLVK